MIPKIKNAGFDLTEIKRFKKLKKSDSFVKKVFTDYEINRGFSYKEPAPHLAGMFAAKEAAIKAMEAGKIFFRDVEVRHFSTGAPEIWMAGKRLKNMAISISHTDSVAGAVAIIW